MHAIRLHAFGPAENLTYERTEDPLPGPGQVRIAVTAAGVHLLDTALREGMQGGPAPLPTLPTVPGREVAGTVEALGEGTDPAWLGRRVVAHLGMAPGGYAELAVVDAEKLHVVPDGRDEAEAVAMIGTGRTTMGILLFAGLTAEDIAIVPAAAGGIGSLLVQHAKNVGATVIGLAGGPAKVERVHKLGADLAVDYKDDNWPAQVREFLTARSAQGAKERTPATDLGTTGAKERTPATAPRTTGAKERTSTTAPRTTGATIVFDSVGGEAGRAAVDLLADGGRHLVFGWSSQGIKEGGPLEFAEGELERRNITSESVLGPPMLAKAGGDNPMRTLEEASMAEWTSGRLTPAVQRFPLSEAAAAHTALETRGTIGKVVLIP